MIGKKPAKRYIRQMPKMYGDLQPEKPKNRPHFGRLIKISVLTAIPFLLIYIFYISSFFELKKIEVEGTLFTPPEYVKNLLPLGTNIWLISKEQVEAKLDKQSLVDGIMLYRGIPDTIKVVVQEREPILLWQTGENQVIVDENGYAIAQYRTNNFPTADTSLGQRLAGLPRVVDTKAVPVEIGQAVVSKTFMDFIKGVTSEMAIHLPEIQVDRWEVADSTYDLTMLSLQGLRVQYNTLASPGVQIRNLTRLVHQQKVTLHSLVDLRVDRWAYVQ